MVGALTDGRTLKISEGVTLYHATFLVAGHKNGRKSTKRTVITLRIGTERPFANSVDLDQMPQNATSHQGIHCLPYIQQYFLHIKR